MAGYIGSKAVSVNTTSATISDDLAVGDDATIAGTLGVTGVLTATSLDISGDIDVDGTTNLDVVDIDGAVNMATTALVTGVLTTTAATVFNGGFASNADSTVGGTLTATKLVSTNGVLELDDNGSHNGIINSPASLVLNIDSDNGATNEKFEIAKDRTSTTGGTVLFTVKEDGNVGIGVTPASGATGLYLKGGGVTYSTSDTYRYDMVNAYFDTAWKYIGNGVATQIYQANGSFVFNQASSNSSGAGASLSWTPSMTINSAGAVTKPLQPAFSVNKGGTNQDNIAVGADVTVTFDTERFDVNADFDLTNNRFAAPVTGKYMLSLTIRLENVDSAAAYYAAMIVTSNQIYRFIFDPDFGQDAVMWSTTISVLADMDAGDFASIILNQGAGTAQTDVDGDDEYTFFTGYLAC